MLGVGRLISDPDRQTAEYAILIRDDWQNRGLGKLLTDFSIEIAKEWGIKRIIAQTTADNQRMISVFKSKGFSIDISSEDSMVEVALDL